MRRLGTSGSLNNMNIEVCVLSERWMDHTWSDTQQFHQNVQVLLTLLDYAGGSFGFRERVDEVFTSCSKRRVCLTTWTLGTRPSTQTFFWLVTHSFSLACVAGAKRGGGKGKGKGASPSPLFPFLLIPYPLPISTPATQATFSPE